MQIQVYVEIEFHKEANGRYGSQAECSIACHDMGDARIIEMLVIHHFKVLAQKLQDNNGPELQSELSRN